MMRTMILVLAGAMLSGCATMAQNNAAREAERAAFLASVPVCTGEVQCKAMWEAAQIWVARNAGMKILTATDVLIETYNSTGYSTDLGVRVLKVPAGSGKYRIEFEAGCANMFGCVPTPTEAGLNFNQYVTASGT